MLAVPVPSSRNRSVAPAAETVSAAPNLAPSALWVAAAAAAVPPEKPMPMTTSFGSAVALSGRGSNVGSSTRTRLTFRVTPACVKVRWMASPGCRPETSRSKPLGAGAGPGDERDGADAALGRIGIVERMRIHGGAAVEFEPRGRAVEQHHARLGGHRDAAVAPLRDADVHEPGELVDGLVARVEQIGRHRRGAVPRHHLRVELFEPAERVVGAADRVREAAVRLLPQALDVVAEPVEAGGQGLGALQHGAPGRRGLPTRG